MSPLKVDIFNVGQGEHILLHLPDKKYGIIDFYYEASINTLEEPPALTLLKERLKKGEEIKIAFLHLSHYHKDHTKGLAKWLHWILVNHIPVDELWLPAVLPKLELAELIQNAFNDREAIRALLTENPELANSIDSYLQRSASNPILALKQYKTLQKSLGFNIKYINDRKILQEPKTGSTSSLDIQSLGPSSQRTMRFFEKSHTEILLGFIGEKDSSKINQNDISVVLKVEYEDYRLIFTGDAERSNLHEILDEIDSDKVAGHFVKVPHHGSKNASSVRIWQSFCRGKCEILFAISAGHHARYDHPDTETFEHLQEALGAQESSHRIFLTKTVKSDHNINGLLDTSEKKHYLPIKKKPAKLKYQNRKIRSLGLSDLTASGSSPMEPSRLSAIDEKLLTENRRLGFRFTFTGTEDDVDVHELVARN